MRRTALSCGLFVAQKGLLLVGAITLAALAVACGGSDQQLVNPASPSVSTTASGASGTAPAKAPQTVPRDVKGVLDGRFTWEYWGTGDYDFRTIGKATGTLSHLGLATISTKHQPHQDGTLTDASFRIVAANGDEIWGTYTGSGEVISFAPYVVLGSATLLIEQGSGRFAGATGTIKATFRETLDADWMGATVSWTLAGTVNY